MDMMQMNLVPQMILVARMEIDNIVLWILWLVVTHIVVYKIGYIDGKSESETNLINDEGDTNE